MECDHKEFTARVDVSRIEDSPVWYADLKLNCSVCGKEMQFIGFPFGMSPGEPTINLTGTEARLPFSPFSEEETKKRFTDAVQLGYRIKVGGLG